MANIETKPLQYVVSEQKLNVGKNAGKIVQVARPTARRRVSFRALAEEASRNVTFSTQEIMACLNELTAIAKLHVENGDIVEMGDLGTLSPSFRSKVVPQGEKFNPQTDIYAPRVNFRANRAYFAIEHATYEKGEARAKTRRASGSTTSGAGSTTPAGSTPAGSTPASEASSL